MPRISDDDSGINSVHLDEQASDPTTPTDGLEVYDKAGGIYTKDSSGTVTGPLGAGGATTPGGSDKNVQYNNANSFGGIANNATATDKFLRQVSGGTPSFEQVTDADLSVSNVTTNDATTGAHGFAPKGTVGTSQYWRQDWTLGTPSGAGDVVGPGSATGGDIVTFNGGTGKSIQDSGVAISTDGTFATNSNAKVPTEQAAKTYTDTSIANITPTGTIVQGTFIVSGCQVTYSGTNLDYVVAAGQYYIQGTLYTISQATVTLAAADTQDRIDVIYANTSQAVGSITGTAGTNPSEPSYDPTTQIPLRFVIVYANSSTPSGVTTETIYQDNAGAPTEWAWTTSGSGFNVNSTNNPYTGTKDIEGTAVTTGSFAKGIKGSSGTIDLANYQQLVFYLRFKAAFASNRVLQCQWFASGVAKGNPLVITQGQFGLNGANTTTYQAVIIPALQFAVPAGTLITELRFTDSGGSIGFYLDAITLISESGSTGGSGGITQQQADARYAQLAVSFPSSSTDKAIARWNGTTGKIVQNSVATVSDTGTVNIPTGQTYNINNSPHTHAYTARSGSTTDGHLAVWNGSNADSIKDGGAIPSGAALTVKEEDGAPSVANVVEIKVTNGTLTDNGSGSVSINTTGSTPNRAYYTYLAAMLEPLAIEAAQAGTFSYAVGAGATKLLLSCWNCKIATSSRLDARNVGLPFALMPLSNVTLAGIDSGSIAALIDPTLPTYADAEATYYARLNSLMTLDTHSLALTGIGSGTLTDFPFMVGPYGNLITNFTIYDFAWAGLRCPGTSGTFPIHPELGDVNTKTIRTSGPALIPVSKNNCSAVEAGYSNSGSGIITYVILPSTWGAVTDGLTYQLRDDFMGASLDTTTVWTRTRSRRW